MPELSGLSFPGAVGLLGLAYFVLGYSLFATLMAALGSISTSAREGQQVSGLFVLPAGIPIYAWLYMLAHPGSLLAVSLTLFPLTSPVAGNIAPWQVVASVLVLLATALVSLWATGHLFRAYLLVYGKRPSIREIVRALGRN